jgi:nicotinamidase/pyrazinamidase
MEQPFQPTERDVLIVVDVQNDFCPGGALAVPGGGDIVALVNRLGGVFAYVILTQDWHPEGHLSFASSHEGKAPYDVIDMPYGPQVLWPDHCVQETPGAAFHAGLDIPHAAEVIRKGFRTEIDSYSAFLENDHKTPTGLSDYLRRRNLSRVFLCGLATDFCVHYSAMDARREGFETVVIEDACRAIDLDDSLNAAITAMNGAGVDMTPSSVILG